MYKGHCLCGSVSWELLAEPYAIYNCHCRMCQKVHGAAFGTYVFVTGDQIRWTGRTDTIVHYRSSDVLIRSACDVCGSVVPYSNEGDTHKDHWIAPGGCHDEMRKPDYNIFVGDNSPWHTVSAGLPEFHDYPEDSGIPSVEGVPVPGKAEGHVKGGCLCGEVTYQVTGSFIEAHNCHCSRCRYGRAAAHASNTFVAIDDLEYLRGEDRLKSYKVPDAKFFTQVFCEICSSLMPRKDSERGVAIIPMGSLDDDPEIKPADHIFVDDKTNWHDITDGLPQFPKGPQS